MFTSVVLLPCGMALIKSAGDGALGMAAGTPAQPVYPSRKISSVETFQRDKIMLATARENRCAINQIPKLRGFEKVIGQRAL